MFEGSEFGVGIEDDGDVFFCGGNDFPSNSMQGSLEASREAGVYSSLF